MIDKDYHRLGEEIAKEIDGIASFSQIGRKIGLTKQRTWHVTMVALGKFVHRMRKHCETEKTKKDTLQMRRKGFLKILASVRHSEVTTQQSASFELSTGVVALQYYNNSE